MDDFDRQEHELNRFIDGEMSTAEEDHYLAWCEACPSRYRALALGLVEDHRWSRALGGHDEPVGYSASDGAQEESAATYLASNAEPDHESVPMMGLSGWLTALAASLLIGTFAGYLAAPSPDAPADLISRTGRWGTEQGREALPSQGGNAVIGPPKIEAPEIGSSQLVVRDQSDPAIVRPIHNPKVLTELARQLEPRPAFPPDALTQLASDGVDVDQSTHLFLFELPDGRQLVVPTQFIDLSQRSQ